MRSNTLISYVTKGLCLSVLIAVGCADVRLPRDAEDATDNNPVQQSWASESIDSGSRPSPIPTSLNGGEEPVQPDRDEDRGRTVEAVDHIVEEEEQHHGEVSEFHVEPSPVEAVEQQVWKIWNPSLDPYAPEITAQHNYALQFFGLPGRMDVDDQTQDKTVRLVLDSITFDDCVMRGEIRNYADDLYARDVTVIIAARNGDQNVEWHWPLTMKPGESAPFELEITWPPHSYDPDLELSDYNALKLFGNTTFDVAAKLSPNPDVQRAFVIDYDHSEAENLYSKGRPSYRVFDERLFELEWSLSTLWSPASGPTTTKVEFTEIFPSELITSNDVEPIEAEFIPYDFSDIYYIPSILYPEVYIADEDDIASDVRVYQVYKEGPRVIDLWELIPHQVLEYVDSQGLVTDRHFISMSRVPRYDSAKNTHVYIRLLDTGGRGIYSDGTPSINFPKRNFEGVQSLHRGGGVGLRDFAQVYEDIWIGGSSHSGVMSTIDPFDDFSSSGEKSCNTPGGLVWTHHYFAGQARREAHYTLGYKGYFGKFQTNGVAIEEIYIDSDSVRMGSGLIRGLLHNQSEKNFAREVTVSATIKDTGALLGTWKWPLSVQPGERAPFEIPYSQSDLTAEQIEITVSATLSEEVDPTRSFVIFDYAYGRVHEETSRNPHQSRHFNADQEVMPGDYLNIYAFWKPPDYSYSKEEFANIYGEIVASEELANLELFTYLDMYARLVPPLSHPELAKTITTQFIKNLRAYTAIFDHDMKVVDVKEIPLFTAVYGEANVLGPYVEVDTIPAPNRWSPNAVRLLRIIPYEDEADMEEGYFSQIWIGGANESVG